MESISGSVEPLAMFSVLEQFATIKPKCQIGRMDWKDGICLGTGKRRNPYLKCLRPVEAVNQMKF